MKQNIRVDWQSLSPEIAAEIDRFIEKSQPAALVRELRDAVARSDAAAWDPDLNSMASTLTEIHPTDYFADLPPARQRRFDRSGWVTMPDRILPYAEKQVRSDVTRIEETLRRAHGEYAGDPIGHIVWAGMGGSSEVVKAIARAPAIRQEATTDRRIFIADSSGRDALRGILRAILESEPEQVPPARYTDRLQRALKRTLVVGVSMGMTSEEPVINLAALEALYLHAGIASQLTKAHFWAMTLENSTVHEFLKVKGWGEQRIPIQIDRVEGGTLSGRNSYASRVALLPLALLDVPVEPYLQAQAAPHFTDASREEAFRLSSALAVLESQGYTQLTLLLPDRLQIGAFWLMQQTEESLGKNARHLMKLDVPHRVDSGHWTAHIQRRRAFLHVVGHGELDPHASAIAEIRQRGYPLLTLDLPQAGGALGALPTLLHFWTHVVLGLGHAWHNDTVGQYYVEAYKKNVQLFILDAMRQGGFGDYSFENVNTPDVTQAKQIWLRRPMRTTGSITATKTWRNFSQSPQTTFDGVTLHYEGLLANGSNTAARYSRQQFDEALTAFGRAPLDEANAADVYGAWLRLGADDPLVSYGEVTYFGDLTHTESGRALALALEEFRAALFDPLGLLTHVIEGPRDNHSRLEMSTGGRNEGLITVATASLETLKSDRTPPHDEQSLDGFLDGALRNYPSDYLPIQALATYRAYLDHGRRVVLLEGAITPKWVGRFKDAVLKVLRF